MWLFEVSGCRLGDRSGSLELDTWSFRSLSPESLSAFLVKINFSLSLIRFKCLDGEVDIASVSVAVDFGLDSESGQTNGSNFDIHSFSLLDAKH